MLITSEEFTLLSSDKASIFIQSRVYSSNFSFEIHSILLFFDSFTLGFISIFFQFCLRMSLFFELLKNPT
ncbi:hypothetical protein QVD17_27011 [Tagetes erecta]|uniref:Uncharacterized protein n=1 Tax=Tagetes erecta TaxID=13708 RepID=A0AAD8K7Y6_TARER|nr:hypothetical protein QVD17_27011 [Tagetes erecta]